MLADTDYQVGGTGDSWSTNRDIVLHVSEPITVMHTFTIYPPVPLLLFLNHILDV